MSRVKVAESSVRGGVAPGFEEVEREFRRNFAKRRELGAACCVYHRGEKVVDLWGGYRDRETESPWEEDTLVLVYSTTKGVAAMTMAVAHSRGLLDYDERISTYWPEFAQESKGDITVRQLLAHQAGLCAIQETLDLDILSNPERLAGILARQKPAWKAGSKHGYHHFSLGLYQSEIIRRVDPKHRSLGQYFQEEIAGPLGVEFYIGLPREIPDSRLAIVEDSRVADFFYHFNQIPKRFTIAFLNPKTTTGRTMSNPPSLRGQTTNFNRRDVLSVEMPSANGVGQVRGLAELYSEFVTGGPRLGLEQETLDEIFAPEVAPTSSPRDLVLLDKTAYSLGFRKPAPAFKFGTNSRSFGVGGVGGSLAFGDPDAQISFAYAMNRPGFLIFDDPRAKALRDALSRCLAEF